MDRNYENFNPSRLILARRRRGATKSLLADKADLSVKSISMYESSRQVPSDETLVTLAHALDFPIGFFLGEDLDELSPDTVSFRAMSKMTARQRDMALSAGAIALLFNNWMESKFELPKASLPDLSQETDPEAAALSVRREWGFGESPIPNMVHLLESKGVRVFSVALDSMEVDAFSMWKGDTPFVFLNTMKSAERSRFDAAHELGHLVLHRHALDRSRSVERQANQFASSILMPRGSVLARSPKFATLASLVKLKKRWNVSVSALAHRLRALGVLSEWHYRWICIEVAQKGYRSDEPNPSPRERSQVLDIVLRLLREEQRGKADIAHELCVPESELDSLMFGLTLFGIKGGGASKQGQHGASHLSVVTS